MIDLHQEELSSVQVLMAVLFPEAEVWAFGSRVKGNAKPWSDLDLVVVSNERIAFERYLDALNTVEESELPFRIDLLDYHRISPSFQAILRNEHVIIKLAAEPRGARG